MNASGAVHYVDLNSTNPSSPYAAWSSAATNIQDAIDAAAPGDEVLVTNGVYETGGRVVGIALTNRVAVSKPLFVHSVNGADVTIIKGYQLPGVRNGDGAVRCVFLTNGASLAGFTITGGATRTAGDNNGSEASGGGIYCKSLSAIVSDCVISNNSATDGGGGAVSGTHSNCTLIGNSAGAGGGAHSCMLTSCLLSNNIAGTGGGALASTLNNCLIIANLCPPPGDGGGICGCTASNCVVAGNSAWNGGGAASSFMNRCMVTNNFAGQIGGGVYISSSQYTVSNSVFVGNYAGASGGAAFGGAFYHCTLTGNRAGTYGGGAGGGHSFGAQLWNSVVYYNFAPADSNYAARYVPLNYCCTAPLPDYGTGNISSEPQLASAFRLAEISPCRGSGSSVFTSGFDIDGEPWKSPPSIGCDEFYSQSATGALSVAILASASVSVIGQPVDLKALISGKLTESRWEFDDGTIVSNRPFISYTWTNAGSHSVGLRAYNADHPGGVFAATTIQVQLPSYHYANAVSANPMPPFDSWLTAATNIQDAIDAALPGDIVLVTNGVYAFGGIAAMGSVTNRISVIKPLTVRSVNGPSVTLIDATDPEGGQLRCVLLTNNTVLSGFTLTNGFAPDSPGGGVWCASSSAIVSNCVIVGCASVTYGEGAYSGSLWNCVLTTNIALYNGGAAQGSVLNNCLLSNNYAWTQGGGVLESFATNCVFWANSASDAGAAVDSTLANCTLVGNSSYPFNSTYSCRLFNSICASDSPEDFTTDNLLSCCIYPSSGWTGAITNEPRFVNSAGGDFRLQNDSPCINAGQNSYAHDADDLAGAPRISGGTVDIGAYEFQNPASILSYAWLQKYGLAHDGSADFLDGDSDKMNNWQEWIAGTDPTNGLSVLLMTGLSNTVSGLTINWQSVDNRTYYIQRSTNLIAQPAFSSIQSNIVGQSGITSFEDTNISTAGPFFYRVGVQ